MSNLQKSYVAELGSELAAPGPANCLFMLRFYGPVNPMGSCQARSIYLTTFTGQA